MDWGQFTNQFSQIIVEALKWLDKIVNQIFAEGIIGHFLAILKAAGRLILAVLEMLVKLLKFLVK